MYLLSNTNKYFVLLLCCCVIRLYTTTPTYLHHTAQRWTVDTRSKHNKKGINCDKIKNAFNVILCSSIFHSKNSSVNSIRYLFKHLKMTNVKSVYWVSTMRHNRCPKFPAKTAFNNNFWGSSQLSVWEQDAGHICCLTSRAGAILVELESLKFHNHRDLLMVESAMLVRIY